MMDRRSEGTAFELERIEHRRFERHDCEQSIASRFEAQAQAAPDKTAVRFDSGDGHVEALSYQALNQQANRLAHALLELRGPGPEPIALLVEQGPRLIAAILGVLKAGKCYVPLEAALPAERVRHMLADSTAAVVIGDATGLDCARALGPAGLTAIDVDVLRDGTATNPDVRVSADADAYIYYTTGSTGQPKGVVDSHRNVLHNIMRYTNGLGIGAGDRLTLLQSPSFSGAVSSLFAAILNGATSLPFDLRRSGLARLADYIDREQVTIYHSVPTIFRSLEGPRRFDSVRVVRLEGDQAAHLDAEIFRRQFSDACVLVNGLGATETGIVRRYFLTKSTPVAPGALPIGYAVEDMAVSVVDARAQRVPIGSVGEIMVCSDYLARGYWNRPDLTAQAFIDTPAGRAYRTGDLGRMHPDGRLEHLGRRDTRVKIRGETVEPAEVEAALLSLAPIREAVVVPRAAAGGAMRLVGYYVLRDAKVPVAIGELRRQLARTLTPAMIPATFVALERMPLNENLKIDRNALPAPQRERPRLDSPYAPARDPTEARLVELWQHILDIAPIGVQDDFFELGGDSLAALTLASATEASFGVAPAQGSLLTATTIEALARTLTQSESAAVPITTLQADGASLPIYFLHGDYVGGGLYCRELARRMGADRAFHALAPCGLDGESAPATIEAMAARHLRALRAHRPRGPYLLGGNCNGGLVALELANRLTIAGEAVLGVVMFRSMPSNVALSSLRTRLQSRDALTGPLLKRLLWLRAEWHARSPARRAALLLGKLLKPVTVPLASVRRAAPNEAGDLAELYTRASAEFIPPRFAGPVTIVWPEDEVMPSQHALSQWRRALPNAELATVPGNHLTALTLHVDTLAAVLRSRLSSYDAAGSR